LNFKFEIPTEALTLRRMTVSNYRVRRATLDDIAQLTAIWKSMDFPVEELAKRITEFQVAEGVDGKDQSYEGYIDDVVTDKAIAPFPARYNKQLRDHCGCQQDWADRDGPHPAAGIPNRATGAMCGRACGHGQRQHHDKLKPKAK